MSDLIITKTDGSIATVSFNNPKKRNALCLESWDILASEILSLGHSNELRCIVIKGAGGKDFSAGADISEFPEIRSNSDQAIVYGNYVANALSHLTNCPIPIIAMISGICAGGGLEIASCCDMRISSDSGRFGLPINRLGHAFAPSEMRPALDLLGPAVLLELLLEGRMWGADEALRRGLVNRIVPDEKLEQEVFETAKRISDGAPLAARMTKKMFRLLMSGAEVSEKDLRQCYEVCDSIDYKEGVRAFLAKESPIFKGF